MTRSELWAIYTARNPQFDGDGTVTLSKHGLHKLFVKTWDEATREALARSENESGATMFSQIFGGTNPRPNRK